MSPSMSAPITLTLHEPPSSNRYWRVMQGRPVLSAEARGYKRAVALSALCQGVRTPVTHPVAVTVRWYRSRKSGDLDNRLKITLDALNGVAYADDKQIVELHAYRADDKHNPRVEITLTEIAA